MRIELSKSVVINSVSKSRKGRINVVIGDSTIYFMNIAEIKAFIRRDKEAIEIRGALRDILSKDPELVNCKNINNLEYTI